MRFLRPLVAVGVLCVVVLALWIGRFRYFRDDGLSFRENRFTGEIDAFVVGQWYTIPSRELTRAKTDTTVSLYDQYLRSQKYRADNPYKPH